MPAVRQYERNLYRQITRRDLDSPMGIQVADYQRLDLELTELFTRIGHEDPLQIVAIKDGNFDQNVVAFTLPASTNTEFAILHGLGRIPKGWEPVVPAVAGYGHIPLLESRNADGSYLFLKVAPNAKWHVPNTQGVVLSTTVTQFMAPWMGSGTISVTESNVFTPVVNPVEITDWFMRLSTAPGGTAQYVFTLFKNSVATVASITIVGTSTTGTWFGSVLGGQGDVFSIQSVPSGAPAAPIPLYDIAARETTPKVANAAVIVW